MFNFFDNLPNLPVVNINTDQLWKIIIGLLILDSIWLGLVATNSYQRAIRQVTNLSPRATVSIRPLGALLSYSCLILGLWLLVLPRVRPEYQLTDSLFWGGLFGLVTYGIFNFTNLAIFPGWTLTTSLMDLAWGMFLCATVSYLATTSIFNY